VGGRVGEEEAGRRGAERRVSERAGKYKRLHSCRRYGPVRTGRSMFTLPAANPASMYLV